MSLQFPPKRPIADAPHFRPVPKPLTHLTSALLHISRAIDCSATGDGDGLTWCIRAASAELAAAKGGDTE